ncbi:MAG: hypothetical protein DI586_03080 [Micavibrio aeruginosavorus]|uniref:Transglutaminase-like domain-containing protein n=1 Tax=Micavibrio aeruginosavorus TaxID=349221 RepID=A0A2W5HSJ5_9BACT|nr:MAG: hypothetical protein DI586_03080 [Micavibrio aeruginosavorus]
MPIKKIVAQKSFKWFLGAFLILAALGAVYELSRENKKTDEKMAVMDVHREVVALCLKQFPADNKTNEIKSLRHCVFKNSVFSDDKEFEPLWKNKMAMAKWLRSSVSKERNSFPPMECSYRSGTLVSMLKSAGYEAHDLVIPKNEDNFSDHVVVEVLNPDTQKWEIHDPSYDVNFVSSKDKAPLDIKQMLTIDKDDYKPCNFAGKCGWHLRTDEGIDLTFNKAYWNMAYIKDLNVLYSTDRLDIHAKRNVYGKQLSYCEWRKKWCNNIVELD